jgi:gluconate 2-dehydrogenase gamma chain
MSEPADTGPAPPSRRHFLIALSAATALLADKAEAQTSPPATSPQSAPVTPESPGPGDVLVPPIGPKGYRFLSSTEVETLTAMIDRLIPADDVGPGGVEAGVVTFIDTELAGQFGVAARWYMQGPWADGTPSQGWQLAFTPAQLYRIGLLALERWCLGGKGKRFAEMTPADQDEVLALLEGGKIDLNGISSAVFFELLWQNTLEGYLSDPLYGGNREMAAWRMINFPGANPVLTDAVALNGELYKVDPIAIAG